MEHVEVLERLRGVLEHGKMGDKCLIAPDLVTAAIASLSAPQPPAEAQACGCGKPACVEPWEPGCDLGKSEQHAVVEAAPPSAPVWVENRDAVEVLRHKLANDEDGWRALCKVMSALAQQPGGSDNDR